MSFWSKVKGKLSYRNKLSLRDYVRQLPSSRKELSDYVLSSKHVQQLVENDENARSALDEAVNSTWDKYSKYLGGWTDKAARLGRGAGYSADAWLLSTGDFAGAMNVKFGQFASQIPEKGYSVWYGVRTGNYLDSLQCVLEGIVGCVPTLTFVDQGLTRIIQKRMVTDALTKFEKETGTYKSWTTKLYDKLKGAYTGVKDRAKSIFRPDYEPEPALQPA